MMIPITFVHTKVEVPKYGARARDDESSTAMMHIPETKVTRYKYPFFVRTRVRMSMRERMRLAGGGSLFFALMDIGIGGKGCPHSVADGNIILFVRIIRDIAGGEYARH